MKNIVITGANRGIGLELAKIYANKHKVFALCRNSSPALADLDNVEIISNVELTNQSSIQDAAAKLPKKIDILINNTKSHL